MHRFVQLRVTNRQTDTRALAVYSVDQDSDDSDNWSKDYYIEMVEIKFRPYQDLGNCVLCKVP